MALTNEQITAQNFKDFYGQIRPYLNGNVPTFANTFNKSDLYSTDEQLIGRWISGKPLYQKVIHKTITHNGGRAWYDIADLTSLNIASMVEMDGTYSFNNSSEWLPISVPRYWDFGSSAAVYSFVQYSVSTKKLRYCLSSSATETDDVVVIIKYTKTTDSSMSITDGNEYSLDEQVVGHWINNKPIYQKTVTGTVSNYTKITRSPIGASIDTVVKVEGVYNNITPIAGVTKDDMTEGLAIAVTSNSVATNPNTYAVYNKPSGKTAYVGKSYYLTIQYTKTTD